LQVLLGNVDFYEQLVGVDLTIANELRLRGCPRSGCRGRMHRADFPRKVRGLTADTTRFESRIGLCCGKCRGRVLPPTVRFFGRSSYAFVAVLVAVATALVSGIASGARWVGAAWTTAARWVDFLQCDLASRPEWQAVRGRLPAVLGLDRMPLSLVEVFGPTQSNLAWLSTLRWLAPVTTSPLFSSRKTRAG
jgi:hypothetical protein